MNARTTTIALLASLLALNGVLAAHEGPLVITAVHDVFDDVDVTDMTFEPGCGGGAFDVERDGSGFRFYEVSEQTEDTGQGGSSQTGGYESTGCGTATYPITVPAGTEHFHVRFNASRSIDAFDFNSGVDAEQSLLLFEDGVETARRNYIDPQEGSVVEQKFEPAPFDTQGRHQVDVVWNFEDRGFGASQDVPNILSGVAFEANVSRVSIEYSYLPVNQTKVTESSNQVGNEIIEEAIVVSTLQQETVDAFDRINVRVQTQANPELTHVILPDGTIIDTAATRTGSGDEGYQSDQVLVEHFQGYSWFTIPYGIVAEQGAGDYTFVIHESQGLVVVNALIPVAVAIAVLPLVASAFAVYGTLRFRREAFGGYQRAATWLVVAILVLLAYYVAVMVSGLITGTVQRMTILPLDAAAWLLYAQVTFAAVGFIIVFIVGRELYKITVPRRPS